ncbi:MAG: hypothetical protein WBG46_07700 [Nonlabens sp.]
MAEIEIEKKKPVWPWILAAVIIAALIYFLVFASGDDMDGDDFEDNAVVLTDDMEDDEESDSSTYDASSEYEDEDDSLTEYKEYIDSPNMGLDHEYANGALMKLISAVESKADMYNVDIEADIQEAKKNAQDITKDPYEVDHANKIRNAGEIIVKAMRTIKTQSFPNLSNGITNTNNALMKIKPDVQVLNQKADVKNFFDQAAELLTKMNK